MLLKLSSMLYKNLSYCALLVSKNLKKLMKHKMTSFLIKSNLIRENLPPPTIIPLQTLRPLMLCRTCGFTVRPAHMNEVDKIIFNLSNSNSVGLDLVDAYIIRLVCGFSKSGLVLSMHWKWEPHEHAHESFMSTLQHFFAILLFSMH